MEDKEINLCVLALHIDEASSPLLDRIKKLMALYLEYKEIYINNKDDLMCKNFCTKVETKFLAEVHNIHNKNLEKNYPDNEAVSYVLKELLNLDKIQTENNSYGSRFTHAGFAALTIVFSTAITVGVLLGFLFFYLQK